MILITGASAGIGEACAEVFAEKGHPLFLVARREERLKKLAAVLKEKYGVDVRVAAVDVSRPESVESFSRTHAEVLRSVSVLVNNAGLAQGFGPIQEGKIEDWSVTIDTNIKGVLAMTHAVLPFFIARKSGHIVNMGSIAGRWVYPNGNVYCATKAAVGALTQGLRLDLNGTGVRVTEVSPGMVETDFSRVRFRGDETRAKAVYAGLKPLNARDIAEIILWTVERPAHVNIQEVVVTPVDQASPTLYNRRA